MKVAKKDLFIVSLVISVAIMLNTDALAQALGRSAKTGTIFLSKNSKKDKRGKAAQVNTEVSETASSNARSIAIKNDVQQFLVLDWLSPKNGQLTTSGDFLDLKLKIFSSIPISKNQISIYHNDEKVGSKLDVGGLFGDQREFSYTNKIRLTEGMNEVSVEAIAESMTGYAETIVLHKNGDKVTLQNAGENLQTTDFASGMKIYWWTEIDPVELMGRPLVYQEEELKVRFKILTRDTVKKDGIAIVHNGNRLSPGPKSLLKGQPGRSYNFTDFVRLHDIDGFNEIYLQVSTSAGQGESARLKVNYSPIRPNLHILSIGTKTNLQYTVKDARDFALVFSNQGGRGGNRLFGSINQDTLLGARATAHEIKGTIEELKTRYLVGTIQEDDVILTFISSHGLILENDFRIQGDDYTPTRQRSTSVSFKNDLVSLLKEIPCKKIVIIDACHSGGARANVEDINFEIEKLKEIDEGLTVIASSRGEEESYEDDVWQNGAFTEALVNGLSNGEADLNGNKIITINELYKYLNQSVPSMVGKIKNRPQHPTMVDNELGDVAIYICNN